MIRQNSYLSTGLTLVLSLALSGAAMAQANDPRLEKIFKDWERRRQAVRSVRYRVAGEQIYPKGCANDTVASKDPYPPRDITCSRKWTFLVDFSTGRYRLDVDEQDYIFNRAGRPGKWKQSVGTILFDGSVVKSFAPPREPKNKPAEAPSRQKPDLVIEEGDLKNKAFFADYWPLLVGHGIISHMYHEIAPRTLLDKPDIELFYIHGQGVQQGRPCLVVRSHPKRRDAVIDELWIDTARDSAIIRQLQVASNGRPITESDIQYQQTSHGWLPKSWIFTLGDAGSGKIDRLNRMNVTELELDCMVSDADFTAEERPGMLIVKRKYGKPVTPIHPRVLETDEGFYRVTESGTKVGVVYESGIEHRRWAFSWLWWSLGLVPVAALTCWLVYRWRNLKRIAPDKGDNHVSQTP